MEDVEFVSRETGWRHRGRPRKAADPHIVELLKRTYDSGTAAKVTVDADTPADEVRDTLAQLRRGAEQLGKYLRVQPRRAKDILAAGEIRFYVEDAA
jgi:hypothetical protein